MSECKAFYLRDLRRYSGWREQRSSEEINRYLPDEIKAELEKPLGDDDVVFLHGDLSVTRSMFPGHQVIFSGSEVAWRRFCEEELRFVPKGV
jgi:hypothetical protein